MDKFSGAPSLAHMQLLYGPQVTEQELNAALAPFYKLRDEYRQRFQEHGVAISHSEAVEAYRLVAPLLTEPDPQYAERRAVMNAITYPCFETGGFGIRGEAVRSIVGGFEREIAEGSTTLYLPHDGEAEAREVGAWDRYIAYRALAHFVDVLSSHEHAGFSIVGELRDWFDRAHTILATRTDNRPPGRYDARLNAHRDQLILTSLDALRGCGLDVTARNGNPSLTCAMVSAFNMPSRTIRDVWTKAPETVRGDKPSRSTSDDPLFAPRVPCAQCGRAGKVPVYRTREGGTRMCTDCLEW